MWKQFLGFALVCGVALAQGPALSGSYGFLFAETRLDSFGRGGGAYVGTLNFESDGKLTISGTGKGRSTIAGELTSETFTSPGSYTRNEDGTLAITLGDDEDDGFVAIPFENGKGFYLLSANCYGCGVNVGFQVRGETLVGMLPASLLSSGFGMTVPVTLTRTSGPQARITVFSASSTASANGTIPMCGDGASGTWTLEAGALTVAFQQEPPERGSVIAGNFFASMTATVCGQTFLRNTSGLVTGNVNAAGVTNLQLQARTREVGSGFGRQAGGTVKGTYAYQINFSPFPAGVIGSAKFDGEGNVEMAQWGIGGAINGHTTANLTGTYSVNPDGTGTISFKNAAGQDVPAWAFVVTDNGTQLLLLRIDINPQSNVAYATARLQ